VRFMSLSGGNDKRKLHAEQSTATPDASSPAMADPAKSSVDARGPRNLEAMSLMGGPAALQLLVPGYIEHEDRCPAHACRYRWRQLGA
jgi:hypothetical protein